MSAKDLACRIPRPLREGRGTVIDFGCSANETTLSAQTTTQLALWVNTSEGKLFEVNQENVTHVPGLKCHPCSRLHSGSWFA